MSVHSSVAKAQDKPPGTDAKAKVELTTDPSPAQKGSNTIRVKLTDPAGKPIAGAQVTATFFMAAMRSEEHTSELQSRLHLVCRLLLEKKKKKTQLPRVGRSGSASKSTGLSPI